MADKKLSGKRVLMVIAPDQFRDEELLEPKRILTEAGAQVVVASTKSDEANGMLGAKVRPDTTLENVKSNEFAGVVVVGGMGSPEHLWDNPTLHKIVNDLHGKQHVVAAICLSGAVLARAGVLKGRKATVYATPESVKALESGQAVYSKEHVVQDGHLITADGPEAASAFGHKIAAHLEKLITAV